MSRVKDYYFDIISSKDSDSNYSGYNTQQQTKVIKVDDSKTVYDNSNLHGQERQSNQQRNKRVSS